MCLVLLKAVGLIVGFLGSILLLKEPVRLRLKDGRVEVDTDIKGYNNRLCMRKFGIASLAMSFITQIFTIIPEIANL